MSITRYGWTEPTELSIWVRPRDGPRSDRDRLVYADPEGDDFGRHLLALELEATPFERWVEPGRCCGIHGDKNLAGGRGRRKPRGGVDRVPHGGELDVRAFADRAHPDQASVHAGTDWHPGAAEVLVAGGEQERSGAFDPQRGVPFPGQEREEERDELVGDDDLDRAGRHPELGEVTMRQLLATWAVHDLDHVAQIYAALAGSYDDAVGPWKACLGILLRRGEP
jgi:hypothetical protein